MSSQEYVNRRSLVHDAPKGIRKDLAVYASLSSNQIVKELMGKAHHKNTDNKRGEPGYCQSSHGEPTEGLGRVRQ